jgi:hypothetical protein
MSGETWSSSLNIELTGHSGPDVVPIIRSFEAGLTKPLLFISAPDVPGVSPVICIASSSLGKRQKLETNWVLGFKMAHTVGSSLLPALDDP